MQLLIRKKGAELLHQVRMVLEKDAHALEEVFRRPPPLVVIAQQIEELRPCVRSGEARLMAHRGETQDR